MKRRILEKWPNVAAYDCVWDEKLVTTQLITEGTDAAQGRLCEFSVQGRPFKEILLEQLKREISDQFPNHIPDIVDTPEDEDIQLQRQFVDINIEGFVPREDCLIKLDTYISSKETCPLLLFGAPGVGKTSLLVNYTSKLRNAGYTTIARFCGISDLSSDADHLIRSILYEANISCPIESNELHRKISELFAKITGVIIIDAIDQMQDGLELLDWLPRPLPSSLKLIISLKEDSSTKRIIEEKRQEKSAEVIGLSGLQTEKEKIHLIDTYLERYLKHLDSTQIHAICSSEGSSNPLFLKVLLYEIRSFGAFQQLDQQIKCFGNTPLEAFEALLERLESEDLIPGLPSKHATALLFGLLACARKGLSEDELMDCFEQSFPDISQELLREGIRYLLRQTRPFLARREGRTDFLYDSFRTASTSRYQNLSLEHHRLLCACFAKGVDPNGNKDYEGNNKRAFLEYAYHVMNRRDHAQFITLMSCYKWIRAKLSLCGYNALLDDYRYPLDVPAFEGIRLIGEGLLLSGYALQNDSSQLPTQLWGRLVELDDDTVQGLLKQALRDEEKPWLHPLNRCFDAPNGPLVRELDAHRDTVHGLCLWRDKFISYSADGQICIWSMKNWYCEQIVSEDQCVFRASVRGDDLYYETIEKRRYIGHANDGLYRKLSLTTLEKKPLTQQVYLEETHCQGQHDNNSCEPDMIKACWKEYLFVASGTDIDVYDHHSVPVQKIKAHRSKIRCLLIKNDYLITASGENDICSGYDHENVAWFTNDVAWDDDADTNIRIWNIHTLIDFKERDSSPNIPQAAISLLNRPGEPNETESAHSTSASLVMNDIQYTARVDSDYLYLTGRTSIQIGIRNGEKQLAYGMSESAPSVLTRIGSTVYVNMSPYGNCIGAFDMRPETYSNPDEMVDYEYTRKLFSGQKHHEKLIITLTNYNGLLVSSSNDCTVKLWHDGIYHAPLKVMLSRPVSIIRTFENRIYCKSGDRWLLFKAENVSLPDLDAQIALVEDQTVEASVTPTSSLFHIAENEPKQSKLTDVEQLCSFCFPSADDWYNDYRRTANIASILEDSAKKLMDSIKTNEELLFICQHAKDSGISAMAKDLLNKRLEAGNKV